MLPVVPTLAQRISQLQSYTSIRNYTSALPIKLNQLVLAYSLDPL